MKNPDIQPLLKEIRKGNGFAVTKLYKYTYKPLFLYIKKHIHDEAVAEEVAQDALLAAVEDIRTEQYVESFSGLLYAIARHKIIDHYRRQKIKKILMSAVPERIIDMCASLFYKDHVDQHDIADKIERVLQQLPNEYAVIIRLKYIDGFPVQKIAARMGIRFKAAESMLFRARKTFEKLYIASA